MKRIGMLFFWCLAFAICACAQGSATQSPSPATSGKPQVTTFMHQTLGESWEDFKRITGARLDRCESPTRELAKLCESSKKIEAGEQAELSDGNGDISVSLVFSQKKLMQVLVHGKADFSKTLAELNQKNGPPDTQNANTAIWSFPDGGGVIAVGRPGDEVAVVYYCKDAKDEAQRTIAPPPPSTPMERSVRTDSRIGETVAQFAAEVGVDMDACHKLKLTGQPRDLDRQASKLHVFAQTCKGLISAEQGQRLEIGKDGEWEAVLDGGKVVSYNDGHFDASKLARSDKLPASPDSAYEIKGDKLGVSLAEYLQKHPDSCIAETINPKPAQHSAKPSDPNSFHLHCTNYQKVEGNNFTPSLSLANRGMAWQDIDFSEQRLYRIAYAFQRTVFNVIEAALETKYGKPSSSTTEDVQNGFGAHFTRSLVVWKNGVSTITLREMVGNDLTYSQVEFTLDDVYAKVESKEGHTLVQAALKDM
jgi:hypothetical protein